jgi:DNA-binding transcriptional ArsR family regulator
MQAADVIKALANERRLQILDWLKNPRRHFPRQTDGDLVEDGVCALLLASKLGITPATLSEHMRILAQAGLVEPKRIKQWIFYRRNEAGIAAIKATLLADL